MPSGHRLNGTAQEMFQNPYRYSWPWQKKKEKIMSVFPPKENQTLGKLAKETARDSLVSLSNSLLIVSLSIVQIAFTNFLTQYPLSSATVASLTRCLLKQQQQQQQDNQACCWCWNKITPLTSVTNPETHVWHKENLPQPPVPPPHGCPALVQ